MKAVIFAGGVGTRLWPLSRRTSPKQFEKILGDKSTLQLTVERILPEFRPEDIFISTGQTYVATIAKQLDSIPHKNIIGEPEKKDVGPAVAYAMNYLSARGFSAEPVVILWSDHLVAEEQKFKAILATGEKLIREENDKIIFIGQKARYASDNLGWIEFGKVLKKQNGFNFYEFGGFKYRPDKPLATRYFEDKKHCWNLGYFISTPRFIGSLFHKLTPTIDSLVKEVIDALDAPNFDDIFRKNYSQMPSINFDNAILEQLDHKSSYVIVEDIGWSDVGTWEALKEALGESKEDNITKGSISLEDSTDNLVYNYEDDKMVVGIDLEDMLIVNTKDVLLVTKKTSTSKIKKLVESFQGTKNDHLT